MLAEVSYTITDTSDDTYAFTFDWVRVSHIDATINGAEVPSGDMTISGSSGAAVLTLSGDTLTNLELNDVLRIFKTTPDTFDTRTVDFNADGSVSLAALDDAFKHDISLIQEVKDDLASALLLDDVDADGHYDANGFEIRNLATGTESNSAVTLAQLQAVETSSGALPSVDSAFDGYVLGVVSGSWGTVSPDTLRSLLSLGTAALRDVTLLHPGGIIDRTNGDSRYCLRANNLSDLASAATARTNLGLGTAAVATAGTGASNVLQLDGSGNIPAGVGLDSGTNFAGTSVYHKGGGFRDHISIVKLEEEFAVAVDNDGVVVSDNFDEDDTNTVGLVDAGSNVPSFNFRNTAPIEVAVSAVNDGVTLTVGTYELELNVTLFDEEAFGGERRVGLAIYDETKSTLIEKLNNSMTWVEGNEGGAASPCTFILRAIYTVAGTASDVRVRIASATSGQVFVVGGYFRAARIA